MLSVSVWLFSSTKLRDCASHLFRVVLAAMRAAGAAAEMSTGAATHIQLGQQQGGLQN